MGQSLAEGSRRSYWCADRATGSLDVARQAWRSGMIDQNSVAWQRRLLVDSEGVDYSSAKLRVAKAT